MVVMIGRQPLWRVRVGEKRDGMRMRMTVMRKSRAIMRERPKEGVGRANGKVGKAGVLSLVGEYWQVPMDFEE
jgi:hypothetical protein